MLDIIQKLEERTNRLIVELESSRVTMRQLEVETDGLRITAADRDRLESELAAARGQLAGLENDAILIRRERDSLLQDRTRLNDAETEVTALRANLDEIANTHHAALEEVRSESEVLRNELEAVRDAAEKSSEQFRELAAEADASRAALAVAQAQILELEEVLGDSGKTNAEVERLEAAQKAAEKHIADLKWRVGELEAELEAVTTHRDKLVAERDGHVKLANDIKWRNGELIAEVKLAEDARKGAVERATGAERVAREAREWAAELEAELGKFGEDRDRLASELASAIAAKDEAVALASSANNEEAEALRRENEDLRLRLNESIARDQRTRERLDSLIGRIEKAETLIEQTELAIHGTP